MPVEYFNKLIIEPTNICNLSCPLCSNGSGLDTRLKGCMKFQQFKLVIDQIKDFTEEILFLGFGEPFLAPDTPRMIDYGGRNNIPMLIFTNGTVLNKKIMDQFKKNYKLKISFSIDSITQDSYGRYRKGGNLQKVLDNLSYLVSLKKQYKLSNVKIIWQFLIMKFNEHEVDAVHKLAKKIGVDQLRLKTLSINEKHPQYGEFIPKNKIYRRKRDRNFNIKECFFINPPGMPIVLWDGEVVPCCHEYWRQYYIYMGNAFKKKLLDIWNSKQYKKIRHDANTINYLCNTSCDFKETPRYIREFDFSG